MLNTAKNIRTICRTYREAAECKQDVVVLYCQKTIKFVFGWPEGVECLFPPLLDIRGELIERFCWKNSKIDQESLQERLKELQEKSRI